MKVVKAFGEGNFEVPLEAFPGDVAKINQTVEQVRTILKNLISDAEMLSAEAINGNLSVGLINQNIRATFKRLLSVLIPR